MRTASETESSSEAGLAPGLRVMIVADHFGYADGVVHGVTTYFLDVLPALVRMGVRLTACFLREPHPVAERLREDGISPIFLSAARWNPLVAGRVGGIARATGSTVLHAMGIKGILMARIASRMTSARTLLHLHDLIEPDPLVGRLHLALARPSDMAICVSSAAVPIAINRYGVAADRVRVIHNGIRTEQFERAPVDARDRLRSGLGIDPSRPVLLQIGRMHPIKGHRAMLRMMVGIRKACPGVVLLLAGDGPERAGCEALARELEIADCVRFLGQRTDIAELLQASDLVVVPSESEGFGLAAVEAFAAGRPVVAFDNGGIRDIIEDGRTGCLVGAGACTDFETAVVTLASDPVQRAVLGSNARVAAGRFGFEQHVRQLLGTYAALHAGQPSRSIQAA